MAPQAQMQTVPRIVEAAYVNEVMREQLEYLIEHAEDQTQCGCQECQRYLRVRNILLEIFGEPQKARVQEIPRLASAA
jgi:hypothetical protein